MRSRALWRVGGAAALIVPLWFAAPGAQAQDLTVIKVATYTTPQAPEGVWIDNGNNK